MKHLLNFFVTFLALLCTCSTHAATPRVPGAAQIETITLDNGMRIIVWPDHDVPSVALYNFVRAGSRNEVPGITGLAHFFEHMMFNGTRTRAPGEFDRVLEAVGGRNNASTSNDLTIYQDWFPPSALQTVFELEADRLRNLAFDEAVIKSERGVVYSERRLRVDDNQQGRLQELVQATAFVAHPYSIPTIGWPADMEAWTMADLKSFFATYYAPNNCTLLLVGDVEPKQVFKLAQQHFGSIPAQPAPAAVRTHEPEQQGERRVALDAAAQTPLLQLAYKGLSGADPRQPALHLLLRILTDGDASVLHRTLVDEQRLAIAADGYADEGFDPGLVWFFFSLPADGKTATLEKAFDLQIERLRTQGVTQQQLNRARNQALADFWRTLSTINGKAAALGDYDVLKGGYKNLFEAPQALERVKIEDIRALANELLLPTRRTVGVLQPVAMEVKP